MSSMAALGGVWPDSTTDTHDLVADIIRARHAPDDPELRSPRFQRHLMSRPAHHVPEQDIVISSPTCPSVNVWWSFSPTLTVLPDVLAGRPTPRSLQDSQRTGLAAGALRGVPPSDAWDALDFFPYVLSLELAPGTQVSDRWDVRKDYYWWARHVLIPAGCTSFLRFFATGDVWATVPGWTDPVRLPDDFTTVESDAWSLFDRPARPTGGVP